MIITLFWLAFIGAAFILPFVCIYWTARDLLAGPFVASLRTRLSRSR